MKICYINPTFLIRRPIAELIGKLGKEREIGLFAPKKPFKKIDTSWHNYKLIKNSKIYTYSAVNLPFINFEWPIPITPMFFINLFRVFWNYRVIHMWTYFYINSFFTLLLSLFFPKRKVIMTCDTFPGYSFSSGKFVDSLFFIYTNLFGWFIFSVPNKIQIYGNSMIEYAKKVGVKGKKIIVLPTGIDLKKFEKGKNIRKELGIGDKEFVLVYAGLIIPRKGIDIMLGVVKRLNDKNVRLLLIGEGPKKKKYIQMAKRLGIIEQVKFFGWRKDIPSVLKSSDTLILPSRGEGLPGIVMEAMACGLPVVTSDIPCISDLVEDGKTGFLCKINDVDCFAKRILELKQNSKKRDLIGNFGKSKIKKFEWGLLLDQYNTIYTQFYK